MASLGSHWDPVSMAAVAREWARLSEVQPEGDKAVTSVAEADREKGEKGDVVATKGDVVATTAVCAIPSKRS